MEGNLIVPNGETGTAMIGRVITHEMSIWQTDYQTILKTTTCMLVCNKFDKAG